LAFLWKEDYSMSLLTLIVVLVVVGVVMWAINTYIPMEAGIKKLLNVAVIVALVLWLLFSVFGVSFPNIRVGV
jgi:uncharacterized membrane-anchored protein